MAFPVAPVAATSEASQSAAAAVAAAKEIAHDKCQWSENVDQLLVSMVLEVATQAQ